MIYGIDTGFLVAAEVTGHPDHQAARRILSDALSSGHQLALAPQVLAEFIHVVTDAKRFTQPLNVSAAIQNAFLWWTARDVVQVFPDRAAILQFLTWLQAYSLGRKRLLDTMLAATFFSSQVTTILTTNASDFAVFEHFNCITPRNVMN